jgi:hypothetical protein
VVEGSLPESLHKIPIEKRFTKAYVREVRHPPDRARDKEMVAWRAPQPLAPSSLFLWSRKLAECASCLHRCLL